MNAAKLRKYVLFGLLVTTSACSRMVLAQSPNQSELVRSLEATFHDKSFAKIPEKLFPAADYGAKPDGKTLNTMAIQSAIDAAHDAGGGVVMLPPGTSVSGAIFVKSMVELRLDKGVCPPSGAG